MWFIISTSPLCEKSIEEDGRNGSLHSFCFSSFSLLSLSSQLPPLPLLSTPSTPSPLNSLPSFSLSSQLPPVLLPLLSTPSSPSPLNSLHSLLSLSSQLSPLPLLSTPLLSTPSHYLVNPELSNNDIVDCGVRSSPSVMISALVKHNMTDTNGVDREVGSSKLAGHCEVLPESPLLVLCMHSASWRMMADLERRKDKLHTESPL